MLNEAIDTEPVDGIIAFRCECGAARLQSTHPLRRDQYEAVRLNARRFVIAPGHAVTELEHEVERHAEHALVDTHRHTSDLADRTDPASWAPTEDPGAGRLVADTDEAAGNELLRPIESPGSLDPTRGVFATHFRRERQSHGVSTACAAVAAHARSRQGRDHPNAGLADAPNPARTIDAKA